MTSREEIERLLNQTGRTLEGLPTEEEYLSADDCAERYRNIESAKRCGNFKCTIPFMLHQSDTIELLIGALKDALELKWIDANDSLPERHGQQCAGLYNQRSAERKSALVAAQKMQTN